MDTTGVVTILNALPVSKLITTVSSAIGKAYEPKHKKRMAESAAFEINAISEAIRNNSDVIITYENGSVLEKSPEFEDFVNRTQQRLAFQELKKQNNIEKVIDIAYDELVVKENVSQEPVEKDWISSFFDYVANISNERLQIIWGKILAGEIEKPNTFSIRTLDTIRKLSQKEAIMFERIAPYVVKCYGNNKHTFYDYFLLSEFLDTELSIQKDIDFPLIMELSNAGLISSDSHIGIGVLISPNQTESFYGIDKIIQITNNCKSNVEIGSTAFILTQSGVDLLSIILPTLKESAHENYIHDCWEILSRDLDKKKKVKVKFVD